MCVHASSATLVYQTMLQKKKKNLSNNVISGEKCTLDNILLLVGIPWLVKKQEELLKSLTY